MHWFYNISYYITNIILIPVSFILVHFVVTIYSYLHITSTKDHITSTKDHITSTKDHITSTKDHITSTYLKTIENYVVQKYLKNINYSNQYDILSTDLIITINNYNYIVSSHSLRFCPNTKDCIGIIYLIHGVNSGPIYWLDAINELVKV